MPEERQTYVLGIRQYDPQGQFALSPDLIQVLDEDTARFNIQDCLDSIDDNVDYICETEGLDRSSFDENTMYYMVDLTEEKYHQISRDDNWIDHWQDLMEHPKFGVTEQALRDRKELHQNILRTVVNTQDGDYAYIGEAITVPDDIEHTKAALEDFDFGQVDMNDKMQIFESPYGPSIATLGVDGSLGFGGSARWNQDVAQNSQNDVKEIENKLVKSAFIDKYGMKRYGIYQQNGSTSKTFTHGLVDSYDEEADKVKEQNMWNDQDFREMQKDNLWQERRDKKNYDFARDLNSKHNREVSFGDGNIGTTNGTVGQATGETKGDQGRQSHRGGQRQ